MVEGVQTHKQTSFAMTECKQQLFEFQTLSQRGLPVQRLPGS
jgi:hypothetical protein